MRTGNTSDGQKMVKNASGIMEHYQDGLLTSCADYSFDLRRLGDTIAPYMLTLGIQAERCNDFIPSSSSMTLRRWVSWLEARIEQLGTFHDGL